MRRRGVALVVHGAPFSGKFCLLFMFFDVKDRASSIGVSELLEITPVFAVIARFDYRRQNSYEKKWAWSGVAQSSILW